MNNVSHKDIYATLRQQIIQGSYQGGERLVEERLADALGVSRTPIREALTMLASEGLVQMFPNRGAVVRSFAPDDIRASYDLRAVLEGYGAFQAALRITPDELLYLRSITEEMEHSLDQDDARSRDEIYWLVERNQHFHYVITKASGNSMLPALYRQLVNLPLMYRSFYWYSREEHTNQIFFHRRIIDALAAHDPERARVLMQEHIYEGRDALIRNMSTQSNHYDQKPTRLHAGE
jgi:DNA-binding GntR family transcriptional regulator